MRRDVLVLVICAVTVSLSPAQTFTKLADFDGTNGAYPAATLIQASDGNLYGTTDEGSDDLGTVFKITTEGTLTSLHKFNGADGDNPGGSLVQASDRNFYGTTAFGGLNDDGTFFKITAEGMLTTLYSFDYNGHDGYYPITDLVQATDGNFYGTTVFGGSNDDGSIFKITPSGMLTTIYSFNGVNNFPGSLVQASDGNFYGTTQLGGTNYNCNGPCGMVFMVTPGGILTTLYSFCSQPNCTDGDGPGPHLVQARDGNFYGTTYSGGISDQGTLFKITAGGTLTTLHRFNGEDGLDPTALMQATDGNFYGTTGEGGSNGQGTVFRITNGGTFTTLYEFCSEMNCKDGASPGAGLVQAADENFYGTTYQGGTSDQGTVFRLIALANLSVAKSGLGTVSGVDGHIYCGNMCSYLYDIGDELTLSAVPAPGYTFTSWTGCDNVNGSYCYVTMTIAKNVTAAFIPGNVTLTSLTFKPSYVRGGQLSAGTLTLSAAAPPGGVTVALSSDHPGVAHPPSFVFVPGNAKSAQFAVNTFPVKSSTTVTITATAGASQVNGTLTVGTTSLPPSIR